MAAQRVLPSLLAPGLGSRAGGKHLPLRPRAAAALRVPDPLHDAVGHAFIRRQPAILVHEGARQAFERRLRTWFPGPVVLAVTDNRHNIVSHTKRGGVLQARVHMMFLDAPLAVQDALVRWIVRDDRAASQLVGRFIDANGHRIRASRPFRRPLVTRGEHHDLLAIFHELNERYFGGAVDALVTWGRGAPSRKRKTIQLGTYSATERLIRIHRALDRAWVPRYFVASVLYHEMLHHLIPASRGPGRALTHPPEFRARERMFRHHERSLAWERAHLARLLRA